MRSLLALLALLLASAAHAQAPSPAQMGITSTTTPEVLQTLDNTKTWVPISGIDPTTHTAIQAGVLVQNFGCIGDGVTDDTVCLQKAIDTTSTLGVPLVWDSKHLYYVSGTLNVTAPFKFEGPFGHGVWTTTPDNSDNGFCHWGIKAAKAGGANFNLFNISAVTGTFGPLCMQMAADANSNATAGAAINVAPPDATKYIQGLLIDRPYIYNAYDGIALNGLFHSGHCCGTGGASNPVEIIFPTIISPAHEAISLGANTVAGTTVGITAFDTSVLCRNAVSQASGKGVVIHDGAIALNNTTNGVLGCAYGVVANPGKVSGIGQNAQVVATGVLCDQCGVRALALQPTDPAGVIGYSTFTGCWVTTLLTSTTVTPILISNQLGGSVSNIKFSNCDIVSSPSQSVPLIDIEGTGALSFGDFLFTGNNITLRGGGTYTGPEVLINSTTANNSRNILFTGNYFGVDFTTSGDTTGASAISITKSGVGAPAFVSIVGNNFNFAPSVAPVAYPNTSNSTRFLLGDNVGITDVSRIVASAATVTLTASDLNVVLSGNTNITSLETPWATRFVNLMTSGSGLTLGTSGAFPFCTATTLATKKLVKAQWDANLSCWATTN